MTEFLERHRNGLQFPAERLQIGYTRERRARDGTNGFEMDFEVDPRVRTGIRIGAKAVRKTRGRRLTGYEGGDGFSEQAMTERN